MDINEPDSQIGVEILGPAPRRVVATRGARLGWRLAWNLLLAIVCVLCYFGTREMEQLKGLAEHGQNLDGYVVSAKPLYESSDGAPDDGNTGCEVTFASRPDGTGPRHSFDFADWRFGMPTRGESFHLTYWPGHPSGYRLANVESADFANCRVRWILFGLGCVAPYALIMWIIYRRGEDRRHLLRYGTPAVATVWSRRIVKGTGEDSTDFYLSYAVPMPSGAIREEQTSVVSGIYEAYSIGSQFTVLTDEASARIEPYFSFTGFEVEGVPKRKFD